MKKRKLCLTALVSFFIIAGFVSCKKTAAEPKPDCKIIAAISGSDVTSFTYNADGKLSSQTSASETKKFNYIGNAIIITSTTGSTVNSITTVSLNADGLASNALVTDSARIFLNNTAYEYNGIELSKSTLTSALGGDTFITTYTWSGGNLISIDFGSSILTLNYSIDKPSQTGDLEDIGNLLQGYKTQRSKNLFTSQDLNGDITIVNYVFDQEGKITAFNTIGSGPVFSSNYLYDCN